VTLGGATTGQQPVLDHRAERDIRLAERGRTPGAGVHELHLEAGSLGARRPVRANERLPQLGLVRVKGLEELAAARVALAAREQPLRPALLEHAVAELRDALVRPDPVVIAGAEDWVRVSG
jgi:hypothetical protein